MKSYALCPVSDKKINERVTRINAAFIVLFLITFIFTKNIYLIAFLAADFLLRTVDIAKFSLIAISSKNIVRYLPIKTNYINAGPKIFATRIGFTLSCLIIISYLFSLSSITYSIVGILGLFSFLEATFGLCVACKMYPFIYRFFYIDNFDRT